MSLRKPKGDLRGLVVPFAELSTATVTATSQAGPKPGTATPSRSTPLALVTSGVLDAALSTVTVATSRPGGVGSATLRWKSDGDASLRNWDPPMRIAGFQFIDRSTTAGKYKRPHAVRMPGTGMAVAVVTDASNTVTCWRQGLRDLWSSSTVEDTGDDTVACLCPLPSGRLLCFYVAATEAGASTSQIRLAVSDDGGATWTANATDCLATPLSKASDKYLRIRAAAIGTRISVLLWEQDTTDTIYQYVSATEGGTLEVVETVSTANYGAPDMCAYNGRIYIGMIRYDSTRTFSSYYPTFLKMTSPSQPLSSISEVSAMSDVAGNVMEWGAVGGGIFTSWELAILADDDGDLWIYGVDFDAAATQEVMVRHSSDDGATWAQNGASSHHALGTTVHWTGDTAHALKDICVCPERGRALMLSRSVTSTTADDSLLLLALGGWTSVGAPEDVTVARRAGVAGYDVTWIPLAKPSSYGGGTWTETTIGAPTATLGTQGMTLAAAAGESIYYTATPTLTAPAADGLFAEFHVDANTDTWRQELRISDGANDYTARVEVTSTAITLTDVNGASTIATASLTGSDGVAVHIALDKPSGAWAGNNGRVRVWYRQDGPYTGAVVLYGTRQDRLWTQLGTSSALTAGAATTARVRFGCVVAAGAASGIYRFAAYSPGLYTAGNIAGSSTGTTRGRLLSSAVAPMHLLGGLRVHGVGGPTTQGDTWSVPSGYSYPATALDPRTTPSPRRGWRATGATQQDITWTGLDLGWRTGDLLAVLLVGANFPTCTLYRDSGAANKVMDMSLKTSSMAFTRSRGLITPAAGGTALPFYAHEDVLAGASVDLGGGDIRKVAGNVAGAWMASGGPGSYASTRLELESYDAGDAASGTLDLWMPGGLFIVESLQATDTLMLRIPATTTADGEIRLSKVVIGRLRPFGLQYSRGRSRTWAPNQERTQTRSGGRYARLNGPTRPAVTISWQDGIDTSGLHTLTSAPDHITLGYTSADAIAAPADTARTLAGIVAEIGASVPCVLVPAIKQQAAATTATTPIGILNPEGYMYGTFAGDSIQIDAIPTFMGDELADPSEVVRTGSILFELEV